VENDKLFELRRRTFDTPHFKGIEFIEVEAKSIINNVPGNYLPFNWTINPYRGCSHSCAYCLSPDTPILMADGRARRIADLQVGDEIYGTERRDTYRHYVRTQVLAHWSTIKRAYRVTLEDGTKLISSGDHRFLSNRGWKHVIGVEQGPSQRPFLTTNNKLIGLGHLAESPKHDEDYKRGYLCGMIRGDGHISSKMYDRNGRDSWVHQFRLALVDQEALDRAAQFLRDFGHVTRAFVFHEGNLFQKRLHAIRANGRDRIDSIRALIAWPTHPSESWSKGFLAGIYDAEGGMSGLILRISNCDLEIIDRIGESMRRFGFSFVIETTKADQARPVKVVRITGGLQEKLRFFLTVDPAITRKRTFEGAALKSSAKLNVVSIEDLGIEMPMYDITTGTGDFIADGVVSHNCFARSTHTYLDMNAGKDFETKIVVKVNAPELLPKELRAKRWKGEPIAMGTATDPYQRAEGRYKLMPRIIETLAAYRNPFSILTKGTLILRDLDLLQDAAAVTEVSTAFSIGTLDEEAWRKSEPGTPHPRKRIEAVAKLNDAGIPCGVLVAPILPGISDGREQIKEVVAAAMDAGATHVYPILLHLRPKVKEVYMEWLANEYPELVKRYEAMYARSAYAPKADQKDLSATVAEIKAEVPYRPRVPRGPKPSDRWGQRARREIASLKSEQLKLI
jgi:DNA repair photolyase